VTRVTAQTIAKRHTSIGLGAQNHRSNSLWHLYLIHTPQIIDIRNGELMKASVLVLPVVVVACAMVLILPTLSSAEDASTLFKSKCAVCHGLTGRANTPMASKQVIPAFNSDRVKKQSALEIEDFILNGGKEKKSSHAWAHKGISKEDGTKLAAYVKQLGSTDK
jgi:hypothetical protein